jgi:uncharacterized membrane protein
MRLYDLLLTGHILAAIAWIGSGFLLLLLANRAARQRDGEALGQLIDDTAVLAGMAAILLAGIGMVIAGYRRIEVPALATR